MREIINLAWDRFKVITSIIGDTQSQVIAILFYFTVFVPFGVGTRILSDPLRQQTSHLQTYWVDRHSAPTDLESSKRQG